MPIAANGKRHARQKPRDVSGDATPSILAAEAAGVEAPFRPVAEAGARLLRLLRRAVRRDQGLVGQVGRNLLARLEKTIR